MIVVDYVCFQAAKENSNFCQQCADEGKIRSKPVKSAAKNRGGCDAASAADAGGTMVDGAGAGAGASADVGGDAGPDAGDGCCPGDGQ